MSPAYNCHPFPIRRAGVAVCTLETWLLLHSPGLGMLKTAVLASTLPLYPVRGCMRGAFSL
eukprot:3687474-Heterocapsa_arctica.AAC.1